MSAVLVRAALETALAAMSPSLSTAYENRPFVPPVASAAYQRCYVRFAEPEMLEMSGHIHREQGFMQVSLCYPLSAGPGAAEARAELIRATFYAGAEFTSGGVTVRVEKTPELSTPQIEEDRFVIPVRVRFYAHVVRT